MGPLEFLLILVVALVLLGAKALAAVHGKLCADYEGVRAVARQVLRHRILTNFNARAQKVTVPDLIEKLLAEVRSDAPGGNGHARL